MADYQNDMLGVQYLAKLKYLFIITILGIPTYLCTSADRPTWNTALVLYNYLNNKRYTAGKQTWLPISVSIVDAFTPSGAQAVMAWLRAHKEPLSGRAAYANNYMKDITILVLGPSGDVQESWKLYNCFVTSATFGDLDMSDESTPMSIDLTIRFDNAILLF